MTPPLRRIAICFVLIGLAACGGGGGGGDSAVEVPFSSFDSAVEVPFSSFASVAPSQTVAMNAEAITANLAYTTDPDNNVTVTSVNLAPKGDGTMRLTYDGAGTLSGIGINSAQPNSSVSFSRGSLGHSVSCDGGTCLAESPTASAVIGDAFTLNWNYQTFGVWANDIAVGSSVFGALSAGNPTPGTAIPTGGAPATFIGITAGFYVDSSGIPFATASTMSADVDWSARSIVFSTSDMTLVNVNTGVTSMSPTHRINGTLTYAPGVNSFSSANMTTPGGLTGTASGRFYCPAAEEIGGTYQLSKKSSTRERMIGGFGAKKVP